MSVKTIYGYIGRYEKCTPVEKGRLDTFNPMTIMSESYNNWIAHLDPAICQDCHSKHGQIYAINEIVDPAPPLHPNCRCEIWPMEAVIAGNATKDGENGADWRLKHYGVLPEYYITVEELQAFGWVVGDKPSNMHPEKCWQEESMKIATIICRKRRDVYGTRRMSMITKADAIRIAFCGPMTD